MKFLGSLTLLVFCLIAMSGISVSGQIAERINLDPVDNKKSEEAPIKRAIKGEFVLPEIANAGNYVFGTTTTGTMTDMSSGTTTLLAANIDDTASPLTQIGFDFFFQGVRYSTFGINDNGVLRLGATAQTGSPYQPLAQTAIPLITAYGADQRTHTTGRVHYKVIGSAPNRTLVVEWLNNQSNFNSGGTADVTYQVRLSETTGVIEFVYGSMTLSAAGAADANSNDPQIGFSSTGTAGNVGSVTAAQSGTPAPTYNGASATPTNNTYVAGSITVLSSAVDGSRRTFSFSSPAPAAPTGPNLTGITATSITVNWTDASSNEAAFAVYRSTDNVTFNYVGAAAENATSFNDTGLTPSTNYFYRVFAVSEGALSAAATVSGSSGVPGNDTCNGAGGNWNTVGTWADGSIPTAGDNVTIGAGCTVTIDVASSALSITVQSGGTLQFEQTTGRTLTVGGNVTINAGGVFQSNPAGATTGHVLSLIGSLTNNGTLDFSTSGDTAGATITFAAGAPSVTFSGTGATTDVRAITIAKGAQATTVELLTSNFTVRGVNTDVAGYLTLTSGTFKISGTFTITNRTFTGATYTIPVLAGLWLNNPNYTIAPTASSTTTANNGSYRLTQGTHNVGLTGADGFGGGAGAIFLFEGGTLNTPRFDPQNSVSFTMTGGVINIGIPAANTRSGFGAFELFGAASTFTMSGGTINLVQATVAATPIDFNIVNGVTFNITGGIVNVGTAATATNFNFRIRGNAPNINIDNTGTPKTLSATAQSLIRGNLTINPGATLALNSQLVAVAFAGTVPLTVTNNGAITGTTAGSRLYFASAGPGVTYTGTGTAGTTGAPLASVDFDAGTATVALGSAANQLITGRVILFSGNVTGSNKLTLGDGGATTGVTQIGNTTTATAVGTFDVPFTFNLGTGGQVASYLRTTTTYSTGGEINPARTLTSMSVDNNVTSLNIAGGNITVTGAMTLTNGTVFTGNSNVLVHNGAATRTNGFVDGNLGRDYTAAGTYTYFVGQGAFTPVLANVTAVGGAGPSRLTARSFNATLAGFNPPTSLSRNWSLEEAGDITADLSFTYDTDANDVNGNESDYRVYSRNSANVVTNHCTGGPCVNTATNTLGPILGVTTFSRWTGAENQVAVAAPASISGQVRTSNGNGIRNATVVLSGGNLPAPIVVQTGAFGLYEFSNLPVGQTYLVQVISKRFHIPNATRTIALQDNITSMDFVAEDPSGKSITLR